MCMHALQAGAFPAVGQLRSCAQFHSTHTVCCFLPRTTGIPACTLLQVFDIIRQGRTPHCKTSLCGGENRSANCANK